MDRRQSPSRAGFTLVEVLVAILIIALLIAILLPAVRGAFRKAQEAQVSAELNNLSTALASFKNTYGDYPPSRIILCESGFKSLSGLTGVVPSGGDDISYQQLIQRSQLYLRRFWPRVDFDNPPATQDVMRHNFNDFNGNTSLDAGYVVLSGSECLAFFLGGLPIPPGPGTVTYATSGFSKSPTLPFVPSQYAQNRTVPNYEFNISRLVDLDGDFFPSYVDPLDVSQQRAYAYFASYGINSYDPNDDNGNGHASGAVVPEFEDDGTTVVARGFTVTFPTSASNPYSVSPSPNPYTNGLAVQTSGSVAWINPNSFQLFSAGADRYWGLGGQYVQTGFLAPPNSKNAALNVGTLKLPLFNNDPGIVNAVDFTNGIRNSYESDNLTNFSGGRLD